jgi:hypothetical protein
VQGLRVFVPICVEHLAAPEDVVGEDEAAGADFVDNEVEVVGVVRLIGVDEDEIKCLREIWNEVRAQAEQEFYSVRVFGFLDIRCVRHGWFPPVCPM